MNLFLLSPQGVPPNPDLFPVFIDTWKSLGCEIVEKVWDADVVMMDFHVRQHDYNQEDIDWICRHSPKVVTFDEWDRGQMSKERWPNPLTEQQRAVLFFCPTNVHFCRLLDKTWIPPVKVYPFEKPIIYEEPLLSPDDLFNREFDIVWIANTSPNREKIKQALEEDGRLRCNIILGEPRIPFEAFVREHKRGKFFISCSAGGYTDERCQKLFSVAAIMRERTNQLLLHDFNHPYDCLRFDEIPTKEDIDIIVEVCNDKLELYDIYINGYDFMKTFYTREYIATNILNTIKSHLCLNMAS